MFIMRKQWSTILIVALTLLVVLFAVMNVDPVIINFGFTELSMPLVVIIIGTLLIGMVIAAIWSTSILLRDRNKQKKLQKQLDEYENESAKKEDQLKQQHLEEKTKLEEKIETEKAENRELKRRMQNMQTTHTVKEGRFSTTDE